MSISICPAIHLHKDTSPHLSRETSEMDLSEIKLAAEANPKNSKSQPYAVVQLTGPNICGAL